MSTLEMWSNGTSFVVANNLAEVKQYARAAGLCWTDTEGKDWEQLPRNKVMRWTFKCRELPHLPVRVAKLIEHYGPGFVDLKGRQGER